MFGPRIGLKPLAVLCRSLGTMLHAGVEIKKAFQVAADKTADARARRALQHVNDAVAAGEDVSSALREQSDAFPPLMIDMVDVAEESGALPEILLRMAEHYESNLRLRKDFLRGITWPVVQLVAAVLIIAFLIFILGWIAELQPAGGESIDILGWGLLGADGAIKWLAMTFGSAAALFVGYQMLVRAFAGKKFLDPLLMQVPVLGDCLRAFGIARFSWAFALTQQAGMPIKRSLEASLAATSNGAFNGAAPQIVGDVMEGDFLSDALAASRLFPTEYIEMVRVGETSGTVPETLEHLSPQFEDQARRTLSALTAALGWIVQVLVWGFIIFVVFSIFLWYLDILNTAIQQT